MNKQFSFAVATIAAALAVTPVLAQTTTTGGNAGKGTVNQPASTYSSNDTTPATAAGQAQKQKAQGVPPGATEPQYGQDWAKTRQGATKSQ